MSDKPRQSVDPDNSEAMPETQFLAAAELLLREHASELFTIGYAIIDNRNLALQALQSTIERTIQRALQTRAAPSLPWIYQRIIKDSRPLKRLAPINELKPSNEVDSRLWRSLVSYDERERLLCATFYALGWSAEDCARLLKVNASAVRTQLSIFERQFRTAFGDLPADREGIEASLRRRFETANLTAAEVSEWIDRARQAAPQTAAARTERISLPILFAILSVLLVILCLSSSLLLFGADLLRRFQAAPAATRPAPLVQIRRAVPLFWFSKPEEISLRLHESDQLWRTLWIDVQTSNYGPAGYFGAPRIYRSQAWISLPDQSIELFGLHSQPPSSVHTFSEDRITYSNPFLNLTLASEDSPSPSTLIRNENLRQMVFPGESPWMLRKGAFRAYDTSQILNISTLIVDWFNEFGQREARLWIDSRTGLILRSQIFGGADFSLLISDSIVIEIQYDQNFPPAHLSTEMRNVGASPPNNPAASNRVIEPTPTPVLTASIRQAPRTEPAPPGFDPASSQLVFQFPNNLDATNIQADTARVPAVIIADGYRLAETTFGLPWMLRCERSPNRYLLAFNTGSDGTSIPDANLRWLDLRDPSRIYVPVPGLNVQSFAFASDSRRVAAFVTTSDENTTGIYLIDLILGEYQLVIPLAEAGSLVWSPDGESLALVGTVEREDPLETLVVHVRTGQISFRAGSVGMSEPLPQDWLIANWGVKFPRQMGGLEECAGLSTP